MAARRVDKSVPPPRKKRKPATTPEARENQVIAMAYDLAERQIAEGTASSQVITHYLKMGSSREKLEQERLARENHLLEVKAEAMASAKRVEELYTEAMEAFKSYSGRSGEIDGDEDLY